MHIKSRTKCFYLFSIISVIYCNTYFSYSSLSDKNKDILSCYDEIYFPKIITNLNQGSDYNIDMQIQQNRVPNIKTEYNNKYSVGVALKKTRITHQNRPVVYTQN